MLAQLTFSGTINLAQVFGDIVGILTGNITTPAGLSASFNAGSSSIVSTVAPGWSNYDAAAGSAANGVTPAVIRAPWSDDGTKYKNVYIGSASSTQLILNGWETWNSGTHTGTFPMKASPAASTWQALDLTSATYANGKLVISASANHIFIAIYTSVNALGPVIFFTEYTRDDPWSTVANGYPSWLQYGAFSASGTTSGHNVAFPRLYNTNTSADTASGALSAMNNDVVGVVGGTVNLAAQASIAVLFPRPGAGPIPLSVPGADSSKANARYVLPVAVRQQQNSVFNGAFLGGDMSAKNGSVYQTLYSLGAYNDTLTVGSDTYLLAGHTYDAAVRIALKVA